MKSWPWTLHFRRLMLHSAAKHPMPLQRALMHIDNHADLIHKYACVHLERNPLTERLCNELPRSPSSHQSHNTSEPLRQTYIEKQTDLIPKHACVHLERNHLAETLVNELTRSPTSHQSHDTSEHPKSQQLGPSSITCSNCNRTFTNKYNLFYFLFIPINHSPSHLFLSYTLLYLDHECYKMRIGY